jgi:penicillin-binding protein 2
VKFRARRKNQSIPQIEPRITLLSAIVVAVLSLFVMRLYYLQVLSHDELSRLADRNRIRIHRVRAPRGLVFDRKHRPLVDTQPSFDAVLVPEDTDNLPEVVEHLENYLGQDGVVERVASAEEQGRPPYEPITVKERLDWPQVVALEAHQLELPGVSLEITPARRYLYGELAAHLLGYTGEVSRREMERNGGYRMGDEIGKFGLERVLEPDLRGVAGGQEIEVDAVGRRLRVLREIPDQPGASVVLTIDLDLQMAAEDAMGDRAGALVALDPNSGEILALVSKPAFSPDVFGRRVDRAEWKKLATDPKHPLTDRATQGIYPPGSTFKILDAIAGLHEGTLNDSSSYHCPGGLWYGNRTYRCWRKQGHGNVGLHRAIVESCDVFFYHTGIKLGVDRIGRWAKMFGLGEKTGINLDNEKTGLIPTSEWKRKRFHEKWYPAETLSVAIGQGYVSVTPLQMAQFAAMVANGGVRYKPQFLKMVEAPDGGVARFNSPVVEERLKLDPEIMQFVRDAMADVVNGPGGTGSRSRLRGAIVAGKTGTAQVVGQAAAAASGKLPEHLDDHAWFIAFAPKDNAQIAIACVIENGGHGGSTAAPVVGQVLERYFQLYPPAGGEPVTLASRPTPIPAPAAAAATSAIHPAGADDAGD